MAFTLADAVPLVSTIWDRGKELLEERNRKSFQVGEKDEKFDSLERSPDVISDEYYQVMEDHRKLKRLIASENQHHFIEWNGKPICLLEALELSKMMQREHKNLKEMGKRNPIERENAYYGDKNLLYEHATYDPDAYFQKGKKMEREAKLLSSKIAAKNIEIEITGFDPTPYMAI